MVHLAEEFIINHHAHQSTASKYRLFCCFNASNLTFYFCLVVSIMVDFAALPSPILILLQSKSKKIIPLVSCSIYFNRSLKLNFQQQLRYVSRFGMIIPHSSQPFKIHANLMPSRQMAPNYLSCEFFMGMRWMDLSRPIIRLHTIHKCPPIQTIDESTPIFSPEGSQLSLIFHFYLVSIHHPRT